MNSCLYKNQTCLLKANVHVWSDIPIYNIGVNLISDTVE